MTEEFSPAYSLKCKTINLFGAIDTAMAECVIEKLQYLDNEFKEAGIPREERVITLQINSPGGSVTDGLAILDTMNYIDADVATVGVGMAASMAAVLLASGAKGMRRMTENCEVMIHQPLGGASGQASDIIIAAKHIERTRERLNTILARATGKPLGTIEKDTDRDNAMTAEDALEYGLVDEVLIARKEEE